MVRNKSSRGKEVTTVKETSYTIATGPKLLDSRMTDPESLLSEILSSRSIPIRQYSLVILSVP